MQRFPALLSGRCSVLMIHDVWKVWLCSEQGSEKITQPRSRQDRTGPLGATQCLENTEGAGHDKVGLVVPGRGGPVLPPPQLSKYRSPVCQPLVVLAEPGRRKWRVNQRLFPL